MTLKTAVTDEGENWLKQRKIFKIKIWECNYVWKKAWDHIGNYLVFDSMCEVREKKL